MPQVMIRNSTANQKIMIIKNWKNILPIKLKGIDILKVISKMLYNNLNG